LIVEHVLGHAETNWPTKDQLLALANNF